MVGWVVASHIYRLRLEWLIERMIGFDYLKENAAGFRSYMSSLYPIVGWLRSLAEPTMDEQRLLQLVHRIMKAHENRLQHVLTRFNYEILEQSTMSLVLGVNIYEPEHANSIGRVEGVSGLSPRQAGTHA